jgi:hypothetical protein
MSSTLPERLVNRLAVRRPASRRGFLAAATLGGAALALDPWGYVTKPQDAYASVCGPGADCGDGWSAMCCSINHGHNSCPPGSYPGGWWKADRSSFCGGAARYYIDCNVTPGHTWHCHCNDSNCDHRFVACNHFRYGQCNTQIAGVTNVVCRQISCRPPWQVYPGECGHSSRTDNATAEHNAPCLTKRNTFPTLVTFPKARSILPAHHSLPAGHRLTAPNRHTELLMLHDGNLVLKNQDGVIWQTHTTDRARGGHAHVYEHGNFAVLNRHGHEVWSSGTDGASAKPVQLQLRNSGELVIVHEDGKHVFWRSGTHTP